MRTQRKPIPRKSPSTIISRDRALQYTKAVVEAADGKKRRVIDNDDDVARLLRQYHSDEQLHDFAVAEGFGDRWNSWIHLNRGMRRMNLGNCIRQRQKQEISPKLQEEK